MSQSILLLLLLSVSSFWPRAMAQVGVSSCACTPGSYEFTFDFSDTSPTCTDSNIVKGDPGIEDVVCYSADTSTPLPEVVFDKVTRIVIAESKQDLSRVGTKEILGEFSDGDKFTYDSVTSTNENLDISDLPKVLEVGVEGTNESNLRLYSIWRVTLTNACDEVPVFGDSETRHQIGVMRMVRFSELILFLF